MTEETRPGFLANYKIVRPGPARLGPARIRPGPVDISSLYHKCGWRIAADYERHNASAARRPHLRPHAADLASDRRDHSDASAAMRRPQFGRLCTDRTCKFTCDVACHVLILVCMYTTRTNVKICQSIRCTVYTVHLY